LLFALGVALLFIDLGDNATSTLELKRSLLNEVEEKLESQQALLDLERLQVAELKKDLEERTMTTKTKLTSVTDFEDQ